jgi:uncharacterized caspase-like protein
MSIRLQFVCFVLCCFTVSSTALAEKRVALVIGNSAYTSVDKLGNPGRDASAIGDVVRRMRFDSVDVVLDADRAMLGQAITAFAAKPARRR